jgi:hypothetical protein
MSLYNYAGPFIMDTLSRPETLVTYQIYAA